MNSFRFSISQLRPQCAKSPSTRHQQERLRRIFAQSMIVAILGSVLIGHQAAFGVMVPNSEDREGAPEYKGCAADVTYVVLRTLLPEQQIAYADVSECLPRTRMCSAQEIVDVLESHGLHVQPIKLPASDMIPSRGEWKILWKQNKSGEGHWFGTYTSETDVLYEYGAHGTHDVRQFNLEDVQKRISEISNKRAVSDSDSSRVVIIVSKSRDFGVAYLILGIIFSCLAAWGIGKGWRRTHRHMSRATLVAVFSCTLFVSCAPSTGDHTGPRIVVVDAQRDLGLLELDPMDGKHVMGQQFEVRNAGDETLIVESVRKSCTCSDFELGSSQIPPGESTVLNLTIEVQQGAKKSVNASIITNDPESPAKLVSVHYHAAAIWGLFPGSIYFDVGTHRGKEMVREVMIDITERAEDLFVFEEAEVDHKLLQVAFLDRFTVPPDVKIPEIAKPNYVRHRFQVKVNAGVDLSEVRTSSIVYRFSNGLAVTQPVTLVSEPKVIASPSKIVLIDEQSSFSVHVMVSDSVLMPENTILGVDRIESSCSIIEHEILDTTKNELRLRFCLGNSPQERGGHIDIILSGVVEEYRELRVPVRWVAL